MFTNITCEVCASDLKLSQLDLTHLNDQNKTEHAGVGVAAVCKRLTCVKRALRGGPCQFREGPRQGMDYPARLPYNFPSPPLNCFSSSCRSHPLIASTFASTIATKSTTTQRNAPSEPNDASRNAFRTSKLATTFTTS
jgi:hypothetical protein